MRAKRLPQGADLGEIDLALVPRRRFEPHDGLRLGPGPHPPHEHFELGQAARIAGRADLLDEAHGSELGIGAQPLLEEPGVGGELRGSPGARAVADGRGVTLHVARGHPAMEGPPINLQGLRDRGDRPALLEVVSAQHVGLPAGHRASTAREGGQLVGRVTLRRLPVRLDGRHGDDPDSSSETLSPADSGTDTPAAYTSKQIKRIPPFTFRS